MTEGLKLTIERRDGLAVIYTEGYINNQGGEEIARVRRICRLQRDFEANLQSVAVMLDLLDEVERLQRALLRAGIAG